MSYADAVSQPGLTGHDTLGLNSGGLFGITAPRLHDGLSLLVGGRGLLTLTPVLVVAIAGVVAMHREGHRAEAWTIAAIALAYLRLRRRLLAAVRRRLARPALPGPDHPVPRRRARPGVAALAGADARADARSARR